MAESAAAAKFCSQCGQPLPDLALSCPACHQLVYAAELERLAAEAKDLESKGQRDEARIRWRQALILLPPDSVQAKTIESHIEQISTSIYSDTVTAEQTEGRKKWAARLGPFAGLAFVIWKFKWLLVLLFSKGKVLLFGLTKAKTLLSMAAFVGVYWIDFGWQYALGFVFSIYIHEMGHFYVAQRYGLMPSAPMFIPFFGAFVAMGRAPLNAGQAARVGLAGPLWGLGAAILALLFGLGTNEQVWFAIARTGAVINLLNLAPVLFLDGAFAFRALATRERWFFAALCAVMLLLTGEGILILVLLGAAWRLFFGKTDLPEQTDQNVFLQTAALVVLLSVLSLIPVLPVRR